VRRHPLQAVFLMADFFSTFLLPCFLLVRGALIISE
jgi:hypothetical protein